MVKSFDFILIVFKNRNTVVVFDSLMLIHLEIPFDPINTIHDHPFVEPGFCNSQLLFKPLPLFDVDIKLGVIGLFVRFELYLCFFQMCQQF